MEQLYLVALAAHSNGQEHIPVLLLPGHLTDGALAAMAREHPEHRDFWQNLKQGYDSFEDRRIPPVVTVDDRTGRYRFGD